MEGQKGLRRWQIAQEAEREGWRQWKPFIPDSKWKQLDKHWDWYLKLIAQYVSFEPEWKIIDIGCGPDGIISHIPFGQRFGLDPLIDYYLSNFEMPRDIVWENGIMEDIPFENDYFDVVFTTNTLDHSIEPEKGLAEVYRVLKRGGFLILTVNCHSEFSKLIRIAKEKVGLGDKAHPYNFSQSKVEAMLKEGGFTLLDTHKGIGTPGVVLFEKRLPNRNKLMNMIFYLKMILPIYKWIDFIFIAQKYSDVYEA